MNRRVVFITQEDPFYVRLFFCELFANWADIAEISAVVIAPAMGKRSILQLARQMYALYGPVDFVRLGARFAWFKIAARLSRLFGWSLSFSVSQACEQAGVPAKYVDSLNSAAFVAWLREQQPALVISVAAPQIFKQPLIDVASLACVNIHNSLLPQYRGMLPNFWQLYHGERVVGATIHRVNNAVDDGEILLQQRVDVLPDESLESLICRTKRRGAHLMIELVTRMFAGTLQPLPNDRTAASYFSFPTAADAREFRRRGLRLL